jgi:hypothetical protein
MAEHTKSHLWLNTGIACLALLASAGSVLFAWRTYQLKSESVGFTVRQTYECLVEFQKIGNAGVLGLCWMVTISNQSDSRISLISHQALAIENAGATFYSGFTEVEDEHGKPVPFPIILDAGEARPYLVRAPISVPQSVAMIIDTLSKSAPLGSLKVTAVQNAAAGAGLDIIGNSVDVKTYGDGLIISWPVNYRQAVAFLSLQSGRGTIFVSQLTFPPTTH